MEPGSHSSRSQGPQDSPQSLAAFPIPPSHVTMELPSNQSSYCRPELLPLVVPASSGPGDDISLLFPVTTETANNMMVDEEPSKSSTSGGVLGCGHGWVPMEGNTNGSLPAWGARCPLTLPGFGGCGRFVHEQCHFGHRGRRWHQLKR